MLQKEEKIVIVLLSMAVLSLIIGYIGFAPQSSMGYSSDSKIGEIVSFEGKVVSKYMTKTGDNLIITLSSPDVKVFVQKNNGAKEVYDSIKVGDRLKITGKVEEYNNEREIIVKNKNDIVKI